MNDDDITDVEEVKPKVVRFNKELLPNCMAYGRVLSLGEVDDLGELAYGIEVENEGKRTVIVLPFGIDFYDSYVQTLTVVPINEVYFTAHTYSTGVATASRQLSCYFGKKEDAGKQPII